MKKLALSLFVFFVFSLPFSLVSSHPPVMIRGINIITGEKDAFIFVNWGVGEYDFRRDIYYFNGTLTPFYRFGNWALKRVEMRA